MTTSHTSKLYTQYMEHFCPRLPINFAEIQKAINQETAKFIDKAPMGTIASMIEGICRRLRLDAPCKVLLDAIPK
jgi:hypothetical protein